MTKKNNQTGQDVIKALAKTTSLTISQVQEVFQAYSSLVDVLSESNYCDEISIALPYLGKMSFVTKKGRKAGTKFRRPKGFGKDYEMIEGFVEEDEPDFLRIKLDFLPAIQKKVKEESIKRFLRKKNSIYKEK